MSEPSESTAGQYDPAAGRPPSSVVLLLIAGVALALRFIGLSWGLPYALHPDETVILSHVGTMTWGDLNPGFFIYPGFFLYQMFALARLVGALGGEPQHVIWAARLLTASYGLVTVGFVYLLGARLGGRRLGALAAGLCAIMGALTLHAHYAVTDTPVTALATAALWLSVRGWQRRSYGQIAGAAALAGLAVSTKYSAAPVCLVAWLAFMALATRERMPMARRAAATALLAAISVGAFLLTSPYTVLDYSAFLDDMAVESHLQARARAGYHDEPLEETGLTDRGLVTNAGALLHDLGAAGFVLALGTVIALLSALPRALHRLRNPRGEPAPGRFPHDLVSSLLPVAWVLLYYAFMAPSALGGQRYMLPIYPALVLLAALAIEALVRYLARAGTPRLAYATGTALLVIAAGPPLLAALSTTRLLAQRDTRLVARDWITANLEQRSHLAREFYSPPIHTADNFRLSQPFSLTEHPLETYCKEEVDYLILSSLNAARYLDSDGPRFAEERAWYERLDARTRVMHRIEGKGDLELHHPTIEIRRLFCGIDAG